MSLLNGGKGRDNGYHDYWYDRFQKHGQWNSGEKQKTGRFVGDGVREETFLVHHYGGNLVDDFDDDDHRAPEPKPMGNTGAAPTLRLRLVWGYFGAGTLFPANQE